MRAGRVSNDTPAPIARRACPADEGSRHCWAGVGGAVLDAESLPPLAATPITIPRNCQTSDDIQRRVVDFLRLPDAGRFSGGQRALGLSAKLKVGDKHHAGAQGDGHLHFISSCAGLAAPHVRSSNHATTCRMVPLFMSAGYWTMVRPGRSFPGSDWEVALLSDLSISSAARSSKGCRGPVSSGATPLSIASSENAGDNHKRGNVMIRRFTVLAFHAAACGGPCPAADESHA